MTEKSLCIIPARGGSKRLPRKNLVELAGKPLLAYAIEAAKGSGVFDSVCVSSEDAEVLSAARDYGARPIQRPSELAADEAQVKEVCVNLLESLRDDGEHYTKFAILLTTNPFRTSDDVKEAAGLLDQDGASYVMSLVPYSHPPQRAVRVSHGYVEPFLGHQYMRQTQRLETLYRHDGSIFFAETDAFLAEGEQYGSRVVPYFLPEERSVDIDEPLDLAWAEFLMTKDTAGNHAR